MRPHLRRLPVLLLPFAHCARLSMVADEEGSCRATYPHELIKSLIIENEALAGTKKRLHARILELFSMLGDERERLRELEGFVERVRRDVLWQVYILDVD